MFRALVVATGAGHDDGSNGWIRLTIGTLIDREFCCLFVVNYRTERLR
jgi:hypothetical protein